MHTSSAEDQAGVNTRLAPDEKLRMAARESTETLSDIIKKNVEIFKQIWHLAGSVFRKCCVLGHHAHER